VNLHKPFLVLALVALALCLSGEIGGGVWLVKPSADATLSRSDIPPGVPFDEKHVNDARKASGSSQLARPGVAIPYLAMLDALVLVTFGFIAASILLPERALAPVHAVSSLIVSLLVLFAAILAFFAALGLTLSMVGLFLSVPFGTAAYLAIWGSFPVGAAAATLGTLLFLKLAYGVCVLLAQPKFLENKGLVFLTGMSLLANVVVAFLHGFPPGILASIADGVGGIVVAAFAFICAIPVLVWAVIGIVRLILAARLAVT
jgi:hypothetical protein